MAHYNQWMNDRLYQTCAKLSDDELHLDMKAFFGSIHATLNHIILSDRVWLGRLANQPFPVHSLSQQLFAEFPELARQRHLTDLAICRTISALQPADLDRAVTYRSISQGHETTRTLDAILLHLFNHQTHHRGQVTTLLAQLGHDMGVTDLIACPHAALSDLPGSSCHNESP
ncbi:DinB family protein [Castellaniella sp.]|uniref:DinB family protein n=1 Tax=Castellaniella sp. TaxID=1955812 RepID=UPI0035630E70